MRAPLVSALAICLLAVGCDGASDGPDACPGCAVEWSEVVTMRVPQDAPAPSSASTVVQMRDGRYVVAGLSDAFSLLVFGRDGEYVATAGRPGDGPGEFREIFDVEVLAGDSLAVIHDNRVTILAPDLSFVRTWTPQQSSMARRSATLGDGTLVLATALDSRSAGNGQVWTYDSGGTAVAALDTTTGSDREFDFIKAVAVRNDTTLIMRDLARTAELEIVPPDRQRRRLTFAPRWWRDDHAAVKKKQKRAPSINDAALSAAGHVWIASYSYAPTAPSGRSGKAGEGPARRMDVAEWGRYARSVLEAVDASTGQTLAGGLVPVAIAGFTRGDRMVGLRSDSLGTGIEITVYALKLARGGSTSDSSDSEAAVYRAALGELRRELDVETLLVHPRLMLPRAREAHRTTAAEAVRFSTYASPEVVDSAISGVAGVRACTMTASGSCEWQDGAPYVILSEVMSGEDSRVRVEAFVAFPRDGSSRDRWYDIVLSKSRGAWKVRSLNLQL